MENRFGFKDLVVVGLLVILIGTVVLAMVQFDRQYERVLQIESRQNEMIADIVQVKRRLASGPVVAPQSTPGATTRPTDAQTSTAAGVDTFTHLDRAEQKPDFARGDWFIDNFGTKIGKLTPHLATDIYQVWVESQVMEGMVSRDPYTLEFVPRIAERWEISPDGLTMTFYLRRNVTFSDGEPLNADDVIFTFNFVRNDQVDASRTRAYLTMLREVKKLDDYTVQFTFSEPYFLNFSTVGGMSIMAEHFYGRFGVDQFNQSVGLLFGSGPYMLENAENWTPGTPVVLYRNPRYWGTPGTFDRIYFQEIQEEAAQMVMYGNGEHDNIMCTPEMFDRLKADQRIMGMSNAYNYESPFRGYSYIGWNQRKIVDGADKPTFFSDKRVRQAMTMLIDRERLLNEIFKGYGIVATGPFARRGPQANPEIEPWPFDVERAKSLLREAGFYDRNNDGLIDSPDGQTFRFKLLYPGGSDIYEKLVLFFRDAFSRAGIVMEPDRQDWPVLVDRLNKGDFDAITLGWSSTPESDPFQIFHSSQIKDEGDNRTGYVNPDLDKAIDSARRTVDMKERMRQWHQVHAIIHEDQPYTFLLNRPYLRLMNNRFQNVEKSGVGLNFEYLNGGMIPWYVPQDRQKHTRN